ncbi:hypothetical protein LEP1GSC125_3066 [Leptospira mayottensis 200901122]|uniref:Uncharacterized protein n=1 Tax=Leptospira mayottensis 200901122 TaxID=1193010 RepID=A0AA87MP60_9LEPT|nr:hypothetical protein LEP1GSC125_3066 [Leptospira mayottensis 200901122]
MLCSYCVFEGIQDIFLSFKTNSLKKQREVTLQSILKI